MDSIPFLVVVFVCRILASETIAWDENSLSRPVITRNHRRLKGFTFSTFHSASLVSCGLLCQRNPRCVSTNFRKISSFAETRGVCELNDRGVLVPIEEKELKHDQQSVYIQFYHMKVGKGSVFFVSKQTPGRFRNRKRSNSLASFSLKMKPLAKRQVC